LLAVLLVGEAWYGAVDDVRYVFTCGGVWADATASMLISSV
jgi:hypothetical protein